MGENTKIDSTTKLLRIIGSPFTPPLSELVLSEGEAKELYALAVRNKIGLFFLEALKKQGINLGALKADYDNGCFRYEETVVTAANISAVLNSAGVDHVIFKFIKPYPFTPSDVDVLFMCSDGERKEALKMLFSDGYFRLGAAPHQVIAYDLRGGIENMDRSLWGGKKGGIYYIDLYDEVAASHVIYMDKEKLKRYTTETELNSRKFKTLKPEADLAVGIAHSVLPEQLFTLADYYTLLFCLMKMGEAEMASFVNIVRDDNLILASRASLRVAARFHQIAHDFIPEPLSGLAGELGVRSLDKDILHGNFQAPHRFGIMTIAGALSEKLPSGKFFVSTMAQLIAMLNPKFGRGIIKDLVFRRKRETY